VKREVCPKLTRLLLALAAALLIAVPVLAQESDTHAEVLQRLSCQAGDEIPVAIEIAAPEAVALQFDLEYDPEMLELDHVSGEIFEIAPGCTMSIHHLRSGLARVVVFDANLETLPQGPLGDVRFRAIATTDETPLRAVRRIVASSGGLELDTRVARGVIVVAGEVK